MTSFFNFVLKKIILGSKYTLFIRIVLKLKIAKYKKFLNSPHPNQVEKVPTTFFPCWVKSTIQTFQLAVPGRVSSKSICRSLHRQKNSIYLFFFSVKITINISYTRTDTKLVPSVLSPLSCYFRFEIHWQMPLKKPTVGIFNQWSKKNVGSVAGANWRYHQKSQSSWVRSWEKKNIINMYVTKFVYHSDLPFILLIVPLLFKNYWIRSKE